ncbi:MAG: class I SAM-dependent methyltransferase [Myxococcales bacterium]|nr:class I SAM-dependent methyltransferase [Myxococcales bacterium]
MTDPSFWDTRAEAYAAKPVDDPAAFERKQAVTREHLAPDHVVLDVGCGTGSLALLLAPHVREVHGLDGSAEMVRIARSKAEAAGVGDMSFDRRLFDGSFEALVPGSLDMVCAYSLLHLVPDRADALARAFALLKPGGTFVSSTVCLGELVGALPPAAHRHALGRSGPLRGHPHHGDPRGGAGRRGLRGRAGRRCRCEAHRRLHRGPEAVGRVVRCRDIRQPGERDRLRPLPMGDDR